MKAKQTAIDLLEELSSIDVPFERASGTPLECADMVAFFGTDKFISELARADPAHLAKIACRFGAIAYSAMELWGESEKMLKIAADHLEGYAGLTKKKEELDRKIFSSEKRVAAHDAARAAHSQLGKKGGAAKAAKSATSRAMQEAETLYRKMLRNEVRLKIPADFARDMIEKYPIALHKSFGTLKNMCTRLTHEFESSLN